MNVFPDHMSRSDVEKLWSHHVSHGVRKVWRGQRLMSMQYVSTPQEIKQCFLFSYLLTNSLQQLPAEWEDQSF